MVWYLLRSNGTFRNASARAATNEMGVPLRLPALSCLSPLPAALPLPLAGEGGVGVPPRATSSKRPPPAGLWRAIALPSPSTFPASGRGEVEPLLLLPSASTSDG